MKPNETLDAGLFPELTERQRAVFPLVLAAPTVKSGLEAADLSRTSWYRWLEDPATRRAWNRLQREVFAEALGDAHRASSEAVKVMVGLLKSDNETIRLAAAREILGFATKISLATDISDRLDKIEEAVAPILSMGDR